MKREKAPNRKKPTKYTLEIGIIYPGGRFERIKHETTNHCLYTHAVVGRLSAVEVINQGRTWTPADEGFARTQWKIHRSPLPLADYIEQAKAAKIEESEQVAAKECEHYRAISWHYSEAAAERNLKHMHPLWLEARVAEVGTNIFPKDFPPFALTKQNQPPILPLPG